MLTAEQDKAFQVYTNAVQAFLGCDDPSWGVEVPPYYEAVKNEYEAAWKTVFALFPTEEAAKDAYADWLK